MASTKPKILTSDRNTTDIIHYNSGALETKLSFSDTYASDLLNSILSDKTVIGSADDLFEFARSEFAKFIGGLNGGSVTAGIGLFGGSFSFKNDPSTGNMTIEVKTTTGGLGLNGKLVLDKDLNEVSSSGDVGFQLIAGALIEGNGTLAFGLKGEALFGVEIRDGKVLLNAEGKAEIGVIVGKGEAGADYEVEALDNTKCFAAGTPIEMADGTTKVIENIKIGDKVLAFDPDTDGGRGIKVPKRVTQLHRTENQPLINFHGTKVTPGHAYLTDEGAFLPIIEILQNDGTVVMSDGRVIRARTGWEVGSKEDIAIPVGYPDGSEIKITTMRAGTLYGGKDGKAFTIEQMMSSRGYHMMTDGRFVGIEGDIKTAYWEWGVPDDKMIAGKYAEYIDLVEGSSIGIGMPLVPSRPN